MDTDQLCYKLLLKLSGLDMKAIHSQQSVMIQGIAVNVVRKRIKNLHLRISPPHGQLRVTIPWMVRDEAVHTLVVSRLDWIKRQQAKFKDYVLPASQDMLTGEQHFYLGRPHTLQLVFHRAAAKVQQCDDVIELHVREQSTKSQRQKILQQWYREQLTAIIPPLLDKWQPLLNVRVQGWSIKKMKSKWGSCNVTRKLICFNLDLITKTPECLEYVVVHELVHLLEPSHNKRFKNLMDQFMPEWRLHKVTLNKMGITP